MSWTLITCIGLIGGTPGEIEPSPEIGVEPAAMRYEVDDPPEPATEGASPADAGKFGREGTANWTLGFTAANDLEDSTSYNAFGSIGYFLADDVEIIGSVGAWYYSQPGDDAFGFNPAMIFRWHFVNTENWTVYLDAGIGVQVTSSDVPEQGTSYNFTPRAGLGVTRALDDAGTRLDAGVRWHHVSNARIEGDDDNRGRDSVAFYAGIIFPF